MITQLGKELKKLRIDLDITLVKLSELVNLSPAFLSAIETGRKKVPDGFLDLLAGKIPAVEQNRAKFEVLINQARREIRVPLEEGTSYEDANLMTSLARRFRTLTKEEKDNLKRILGEMDDRSV